MKNQTWMNLVQESNLIIKHQEISLLARDKTIKVQEALRFHQLTFRHNLKFRELRIRIEASKMQITSKCSTKKDSQV
jgi:hypothetical protein